jgi:hypothetical protein
VGQPDCDEVAAAIGQRALANDGKTLPKIRLQFGASSIRFQRYGLAILPSIEQDATQIIYLAQMPVQVSIKVN